jgi:hypothetical protein
MGDAPAHVGAGPRRDVECDLQELEHAAKVTCTFSFSFCSDLVAFLPPVVFSRRLTDGTPPTRILQARLRVLHHLDEAFVRGNNHVRPPLPSLSLPHLQIVKKRFG